MCVLSMNDEMEHIGLKRRRFSLYELYREILAESFDFKNIKTYKYTDTHDGWKFDAELNGEVVVVYVYVEETVVDRFNIPPILSNIKTIFNFGFEIGAGRIGNQYTKTKIAEYFRVLATVGKILNEFIEKVQPDAITFFSDNKHGGHSADTQKDNIYFAALDRNTPNGYEIENTSDNVVGKHGIMLFRKGVRK